MKTEMYPSLKILSRLFLLSVTGFFVFTTASSAAIYPSYASADNSQFISQVIPDTMIAGQRYNVQVTFKNIGTTSWLAGYYYLSPQNPPNNNTWSISRAELLPSKVITSGQIKTFIFYITAPQTPGAYNFQWQMYKEGLGFFGAKSANISINVKSPIVLTPIGDKSTFEDKLLEFKVTAQSPNALTYQANNLPAGSSFNPQTNTFLWEPSHGQKGTYPDINFTVTDGKNTVSENITVTVQKTVIFGTIYQLDSAGGKIGLGGAKIRILDITKTQVFGEALTAYEADPTYPPGTKIGHFDVYRDNYINGNYFIEASKDGFKTYYGFALLRDNSMMPFSVTLAKVPPKEYWVILDENDKPLPAEGYYYNYTGGDRGLLNTGDVTYTWDGNSTYTSTVTNVEPGQYWTHGGWWYSLIRIDRDNIPLDFKRIFGPYIKPEYQGKITELEFAVNDVVSDYFVRLRVELKDQFGNVLKQYPLDPDVTYPCTFRIDLTQDLDLLENVEQFVWVMDFAELGDSVSVDRIRLKVRVPDLPAEEEAFLWSYAWLMANYDPATGMVQDRSNFRSGDYENLTATAKAAKITYYAYRKGIITRESAEAIITKIADTLINRVPKGPAGINTLWPHFTKNGGTERCDGTEWASGDTAYAALDMITALRMIGDPNNQITSFENFLKAINWADIRSGGAISHGYLYNGTKIPYYWQGFGMETVGVNWAYASSTGETELVMSIPPSDNGSGFVDNACYPAVFAGIDGWGNDWTQYRMNMANTQIGWYSTPEHLNPFLRDAALFGLSASEVPEEGSYGAYGVGGRTDSFNDGNGEVIVPHYSAMISDIKPDEATGMWEALRDRKYPNGSAIAFLGDTVTVSPLNNVESMRVNKNTGKVTVNYLKGSWNMALQAEGWAMMGEVVRNDLENAVQSNVFLKNGYDILKLQQRSNIIRVPQDYSTVQAAIDAAVSGDTIEVAAGTYNENIILNKSGVILQGVGTDRSSYIWGVSGTPVISCANINGSETIIKGFVIGGDTYSVRCAGTVSSLKIENNKLQGAIYMDTGASAVVQNNYFWNTWVLGTAGNNHLDFIGNTCRTSGPNLRGLYVMGTTGLIKDNIFNSRWDGAIEAYESSNLEIINNNISNNYGWNGTAGITVYNSTAVIKNNIFYNLGVHTQVPKGVALRAENSTISFFNNTIDYIWGYNNTTSGVGMYLNNSNLIAKNNIFTHIGPGSEVICFSGTGTQDFSYNDLWSNTTLASTCGVVMGAGNMMQDPLFGVYPYHLGIGSPCINSGDPDTQYNDFDGTRNDMGVYGGPLPLP